MNNAEAINVIKGARQYLMAGNPIWDVQKIDEAMSMAIEALSAEAVPQSDQYKRGFEDAKRAFLVEYARESENMRKRNAQLEVMLNMQKELLAEAEDRHYIKIYADDEPSVMAEKLYQICGETQNREVTEWLKEFFPSAEPKTGEWVDDGCIEKCNQCGERREFPDWNYCPNCGADMRGDK